MDVAELIREYENLFYAITFGWAFIEGESFVIFAGAAAFKGDLNIYILILAAWLGSFCGDQCWFALGRFFGAKLLVRMPRLKAGVAVAMDMVQKYDILFILSFRFIYGVRNVASPALGMNGYPWGRFALFNFIAAFHLGQTALPGAATSSPGRSRKCWAISARISASSCSPSSRSSAASCSSSIAAARSGTGR